MTTLCQLTERDGKFYCTRCNGRPLKGNYKRACKSTAPPQPIDAVEWFTARHAELDVADLTLPELLAKVALCRSSGCEHLVDDVCTRSHGSACKYRERWFELLALGDCRFAPGAD